MTIRTIHANGLNFSYLEEGRGPLVLLLHGFPDTAHTWDSVRPALARAGFRAVSPFTRGYAPTEVPADGDYRVDTLATDAGALIEALGEKSGIVPSSLEAAIGYYRAVGFGLPRSQRGRIRVPSLAFAGETDFAIRPSAFEKARRFYLDAYEVVTLPGGHFLHREHPDRFNDELLRRLPRP